MRKLDNQKGFSTVEAIIGLGLLGVLGSIGLWQADLAKNSSVEINFDRDFIALQAAVESFVTDPEVCEKNFLNQAINRTYLSLVDEDGIGVYQIGAVQSVVGGELNIKRMRTLLDNENVVLLMDFEKGSSQKLFSRRIELMVDTDSGQITECFNPARSLTGTVQMLVARKICEKTYGIGTADFSAHFDELSASCRFDGFPTATLGAPCPQGQSITGIQYNTVTHELSYSCSQIINAIDCPTGWVKQIDFSGQSECLPLPLDLTKTTMNLPSSCRLNITEQNKIKFECN